MKLKALALKEARDIFSNRIYMLLILVQVIIILGAYGLAIVSSVAADPQLIERWGGSGFLKVGVVDGDGLLTEGLEREGLSVREFSDIESARKSLGSEVVAILYLSGGDVRIEADTSSVFYTIMSERLQGAASWYISQKRFRESGLPSVTIQALEEPVKLKVVPIRREDYRPLALESSYFVEIMYGFILPFVVFLPFFLGSNMVTDSVVGEKERKTFEVLLMVPLSETMIILGKIIPSLVFSFIQSMLWLGLLVLLRVPVYNMPLLALLLLITGLAFTGVGLFISILADSTKEANSAITVVLFFATFILFVPLFMDMGALTPLIRFIPSLIIVKMSSGPHLDPVIIYDMVPSTVFSVLIFLAAVVSFRREGVIRL
ncbi:ABC-2 type transport system permease protein [Methanothermobacter defluvii]|uniref:ABC-2 type transport system permease protein n=1 Tax=Methanothermobacter defluvii TaxID=49339 RepID=A0A371NDI4_9EURY|nr:ABC transporter permease [Methanothermobacter defluvii]REE28030.1 ABC-2 type transport system permease protein [Methanothermobacter defluvii]